MKYFLFIWLLVFVSMSQGQSCSAMLDIPGMQIGMVKMKQLNIKDSYKDIGQVSFSHYTIILQQPIPNNKAILSINSINTQTSTLNLFDLTINSITDSEIQLTFIYQHSKWNEVSYRYLVTNRTQELYLQMITFSERQLHLFYTDDQNDGDTMVLKASTLLDRVIGEEVWNYRVLGFIRGLKYKNVQMKQHSLSITISNLLLTQQTIEIDITQLPQNIQLQLLSISLIYFNPKQLTFVPFGGLVTRNNFIGSLEIDVLDLDLPGQLYEFYGISSINFVNYNRVRVEADINDKFYFNLQVSQIVEKVDFMYFVVGLDPESVCSLCENKKYLSGKQCVQKCGVNQTIYQFQNSSQLACIKIENNQKIQTKVETNLNKVIVGQVSKEQSFIQVNSQPQVINQQQHDKNTQQQSSQQIISQNNNNQYCKHVSNSYWTGESCQCKVGYVMNLGYCHQIDHHFQPYVVHEQNIQNQPQQNIIKTEQQFYMVENIKTNDLSNNPSQEQSQTQKSRTFCLTNLQIYNQQIKKCQCINGLSYMQDQSTQSLSCVKCKDFQGFFEQEDGMCKYCGQNKIYDSLLLKCKCKDGFLQKQSGQCTQNVKQLLFQPIKRQQVQQRPSIINQHNNTEGQRLQISNNENNIGNTFQQENIHISDNPQHRSPIVDNNNPKISQRDIKNNVQHIIQPSHQYSNQFNQGSDIPQITSHVISQLVTSPRAQHNDTNEFNNNDVSTTSTTNIPTINNNSNENIDKSVQQTNIKAISNVGGYDNSSNQSVSTNTQAVVGNMTNNDGTQNISPTTTTTTTTTITTNNQYKKQCMKLLSTPQLNTANLFITLQLSTQITFYSQEQMQNFLHSQFYPQIYKPSSIYCNQQQENKKVFQCLLLYTSGIPNQKYQINFSFIDQLTGQTCFLNIPIDPLELAAKSIRSSRKRL